LHEITDPKTQLKGELHTLLNKRNIRTKITSKNSNLASANLKQK
jgi:hypothetical protein